MASNHNQEKPSLILMLAPIAVAVLGYYYLFFSSLNKEVVERQRQETVLQEQTRNFQRDKSSLMSQLNGAKQELDEAGKQTELAEAELAQAEAEKAELIAFLLGQIPAAAETGGSKQEAASLVSQFATMLTSAVPTDNDGLATGGLDVSGGKCNQMNLLCTILDTHQLRRLENTDPPRLGSESLVSLERSELGKLLGMELPPSSRFQLQLEGRFADLIAALHELDERVPAVSVLSVSLDPGKVETRRRVWKLEVGIRG